MLFRKRKVIYCGYKHCCEGYTGEMIEVNGYAGARYKRKKATNIYFETLPEFDDMHCFQQIAQATKNGALLVNDNGYLFKSLKFEEINPTMRIAFSKEIGEKLGFFWQKDIYYGPSYENGSYIKDKDFLESSDYRYYSRAIPC